MKKNILYVIISLVVIGIVGGLIYIGLRNLIVKPDEPDKPINPIVIDGNSDFDFKIIKQTQSYYNQNYMISPLSIAYAFTILKEGAKENTLKELNDVIGNYQLPKAFAVKNKISIANLLFINTTYKNDISEDYIKTIQNTYGSDLLFDQMRSPEKINNWISDKTFKMIPKALNQISPDLVMGIANAIAIDVEWNYKFECTNTYTEDFTKEDKTKMEVAMMHQTDGAKYIENKNAKGIIKDYAIYDRTTGEIVYEENNNTIALEYIAIRPNTTVHEYISLLDKNELNDLLGTKKSPDEKTEIKYALPKYKYDFDYKRVQDALQSLGMNDVFNPGVANLKGLVKDNSKLNLYVDEVIHKSHIEVSEDGTKAAAVTIIMVKDAAFHMTEEKKVYEVKFDKPFIYIIKEKNSDNIWFFGTVYEPMKAEDNKNCGYN